MPITISQPLGTKVERVASDMPLGGPGSGNWAHIGRLGKWGGSAPRDKGMTIAKGHDWLQRYEKVAGHKHVYEKELEKERAGKLKKEEEKQETSLPKKSAMRETSGLEMDRKRAVEGYGRDMGNVGVKALCSMMEVPVAPYDMTDHGVRGQVKDELVSELSERSGVDYESVNTVIGQWAETSNDTDYRALSLQEDICAELGIALSPWQKEKIALLKASGYASDQHSTLGQALDPKTGKPHASPREKTRKIIRAMYELTQEEFAKQGITELTLFRGVTNQKAKTEGEVKTWKGNAAESWSATVLTANSFSSYEGIIVGAKIPASRILGCSRTGFGCLNEEEFVILGNTGHNDKVVVVKPSGTYLHDYNW